jgi:DNA (cytosine-5)-methyltransferase 1
MRPPALRIHSDELIVDSFAGGGGASLGIEWATGRSPDIAINHDREAISMHEANHPTTKHYCEDVWKVDPKVATGGRRVALAWFSPDCKHFSKAKGGKPVEKKIRGLAWVVTRWAKAVRPRVIILENVEEFQDWGPLLDDGRPCPLRRGLTFRRWLGVLRNCGYEVEVRELRAMDYGAPTSRKRLFVIARSDGLPIAWPEPTHGERLQPYRTAAECLDFAIPVRSIFERKKPLAKNTEARIARGIWRFVLNSPRPFVIPLTHHWNGGEYDVNEPMRTITGAHRGEHALVEPFLLPQTHGENRHGPDKRTHGVDEPLRTLTTRGAQYNMVAPLLVGAGGPTYSGKPRRADVPFGTALAENHQALCAAFLARHYGGHENDGASLQLSIPTVTAKDHHALATSHLMKLYGTCKDGQPTPDPFPTIRAEGTHIAEVRAFLIAYFGNEKDGGQLDLPMRTVTTKDRFGLVTVHGHDYVIADIGMRMLVPRELFNAQGFPAEYRIDIGLTKTAQVRMAGNSVCPPIARALVAAQFAANAKEVAV